MNSFRKKWIFPAFFVIFFIFHLILAVYIAKAHPVFFLHDDGSEYLEQAESFASSGRFISEKARYYEAPRSGPIPEGFRSLLLPFTGGICIFIARDPMIGAALCQALAATALAWTFFAIGKRLSGMLSGGVWTLGVSLLQPIPFIFTIRFSSELLFLLFLMLFFHAWLLKERSERFALMGLWSGLASLVRPTAILFLFAFLVFELVSSIFPKLLNAPPVRTGIRNYAVFAGVFLLFALGVGFRNQVCFGSFNMSSYLGGFNFFVGNNIDNMRAYHESRDGHEFLVRQRAGWDRALKIASELPKDMPLPDQQKIFMKKTFEELKSMSFPEQFSLFWGKMWHFFRPWPLAGAHPFPVFAGISIAEILLYLLGGAGFYALRKRPDTILFLLMLIGTGCAAHVLVHVIMRHRVPFLDSVLTVCAGFFLNLLWIRFREWKKNRFSGEK